MPESFAGVCAFVQGVPAWALWVEVALGLLAVISARQVRRVRGRTPVLLALLGLACLGYGALGLVGRT